MPRKIGGGFVLDCLQGIEFPTTKNDLVNQARKNCAWDDVQHEIGNMPEQEYGTIADVMKNYGDEHGRY